MKTLFYSIALFATLAANAVSAQSSVSHPSYTSYTSSAPPKTAGYAYIPRGQATFLPGGVQVVGGGNVYVYNANKRKLTGVIGPTPCKNPNGPEATVVLKPTRTATVHVPTTGGTDPLYLWVPQACNIPLTIDRRSSIPTPTWTSTNVTITPTPSYTSNWTTSTWTPTNWTSTTWTPTTWPPTSNWTYTPTWTPTSNWTYTPTTTYTNWTTTPTWTSTNYTYTSTVPPKTAGYAYVPSGQATFQPGGVQVIGGGNVYVVNYNQQPLTGVIGRMPCQDPGSPEATVVLNPSRTATVHVPTAGGTDPMYLWVPQACRTPLTIDRRSSIPTPTWTYSNGTATPVPSTWTPTTTPPYTNWTSTTWTPTTNWTYTPTPPYTSNWTTPTWTTTNWTTTPTWTSTNWTTTTWSSTVPSKTAGYAAIPSGQVTFRPGFVEVIGGGNVYVYNSNAQQLTGLIGPTPCQNPGNPEATVVFKPSWTQSVHVPTAGGTNPLYLWLTQACTRPLTIDRRTSTPTPTATPTYTH